MTTTPPKDRLPADEQTDIEHRQVDDFLKRYEPQPAPLSDEALQMIVHGARGRAWHGIWRRRREVMVSALALAASLFLTMLFWESSSPDKPAMVENHVSSYVWETMSPYYTNTQSANTDSDEVVTLDAAWQEFTTLVAEGQGV